MPTIVLERKTILPKFDLHILCGYVPNVCGTFIFHDCYSEVRISQEA